MNFKTICIIFISMHFLYSESNFSIALRDGKSIGLYSGFHKWEYYDKNIDINNLSIGYTSKLINLGIGIPIGSDAKEKSPSIGVGHSFYVNPYISLSLSGSYFKDKTNENVYWRGPTRQINLGFTNRVEINNKSEYFWGITRVHSNYNFGYEDGTEIFWSVLFSLKKGFNIEPWLSIWKWDRYDSKRGIGLVFSYKFILK